MEDKLYEVSGGPGKVIVLDSLTYASSMSRINGLMEANPDDLIFIHGDIADSQTVKNVYDSYNIDYVVNFAASNTCRQLYY